MTLGAEYRQEESRYLLQIEKWIIDGALKVSRIDAVGTPAVHTEGNIGIWLFSVSARKDDKLGWQVSIAMDGAHHSMFGAPIPLSGLLDQIVTDERKKQEDATRRMLDKIFGPPTND